MDYDGDGHMDILTGSWPGEFYFFKGEGKGKFAAGVPLKDKEGQVLNLGRASTAFACDWLGTGKLDLLVGCIEGDVWLVPNEGTRTNPAYSKGRAQKLEVGGKAIRANHGDSHPVAADWDKDGKLDLVVGTGAGSVLFYRNVGNEGEPKLAASQTLVPEAMQGREFNQPPKEGQWGMRAKICITDWNGDGWPDLLLGDYNHWFGPAPKLSEEDKKTQAAALREYNKILQVAQPLFERQNKLQKPPANESAEERGKREKEIADLQKQLQKQLEPFQKDLSRVQQVFMRFQPKYQYKGNVWLFLRRPLEAARTE